MNKANRALRIAFSIALVILAGCGAGAPLYNVKDSTVPAAASGKAIKLDDVTKAIVLAGVGLGWEMRVVKPSQIVGVLHLRSHTAIVDIPYSATSYSIVYNSSQNLEYDADDSTIHPNYNLWIRSLDKAIRGHLTTIGF